MQMKTLKERVLAKCKELCGDGKFAKFSGGNWSIIFAFGGKWAIEHFSGDIQINIDVNANEDSEVWPLAASVLGIRTPINSIEIAFRKGISFGVQYCGEKEAQWISRACFSESANASLKAILGESESPKPDWVKEELFKSLPQEMRDELVAEFLGLPKPPIRSLLLQAFAHGKNSHTKKLMENFNAWLKDVGASSYYKQLEEDRELVAKAWNEDSISIATDEFCGGVDIAHALKRLCGLEVGG